MRLKNSTCTLRSKQLQLLTIWCLRQDLKTAFLSIDEQITWMSNRLNDGRTTSGLVAFRLRVRTSA